MPNGCKAESEPSRLLVPRPDEERECPLSRIYNGFSARWRYEPRALSSFPHCVPQVHAKDTISRSPDHRGTSDEKRSFPEYGMLWRRRLGRLRNRNRGRADCDGRAAAHVLVVMQHAPTHAKLTQDSCIRAAERPLPPFAHLDDWSLTDLQIIALSHAVNSHAWSHSPALALHQPAPSLRQPRQQPAAPPAEFEPIASGPL